MKLKIYMALLLSALFIWSAFCAPVYAAVSDYESYEPSISMVISTSWLDDELLRIDVLDTESGEISSLAIRIADFVSDATNLPYIFIQAADLDGNLSGIIQISNPFYDPNSHIVYDIEGDKPDDSSDYTDNSGLLTPDGTGTVVDNIVTQNEIEFFTVFTEDGGEFFLVVDRQGSADNVYLLNAVTLDDLTSLAQSNDGTGSSDNVSAIPTPPPLEPPVEEQIQLPQAPQLDPELEEPPVQNTSSGNSNIIIIIVVFVIVGGAAYYFKVVKGKDNHSDSDEDDEDDSDYSFLNDDEIDEDSNTDEGGEDE